MKRTLFFRACCALFLGVVLVGAGSVAAAPGGNNGNSGGGSTAGKRMTVQLTDYRFRNDDGSETAATWSEDANTPITLSPGDHFRLRVRVAETAGVGPKHNEDPVKSLYWQERVVAPDTNFSPEVAQCDSLYYDDSALFGADSTEQLQTPSANYITDNDGLFDWNSSRTNVDLAFDANKDVELEACLVVPTDAVPGTDLEFKVDGLWGVTPLDGILNTAVVHVM